MTKDLLTLSSFPRLLLEALIIIATFPVGHQPQQKLAISSTSINILCSEPPNMALRCLQLCDFQSFIIVHPAKLQVPTIFLQRAPSQRHLQDINGSWRSQLHVDAIQYRTHLRC
jgi:hypothetical protein